jgi:hypothetical protein
MKNIVLLLLLTLMYSCSEKETNMVVSKKEGSKDVKVNLRPTGELHVTPGFFFDDFTKKPRHQYFEDPQAFRYSKGSLSSNKSIEKITHIDSKQLKLTLFPGQWHNLIEGYRSELVLHGGNPCNEEEWYEWSFKIPRSYIIDAKNIGKEVSIVQFHYVQPVNTPSIINRPTISLLYLEQYDKQMLLMRYGINGNKDQRLEGEKWKLVALKDDFKKGNWYKFRMNINWSQTNHGYIAAWINDRCFTPFNGVNNKVFGANMYNDLDNTIKFGYYRYWDNSTPSVIYFDYMKIARSFEDLTGRKSTAEELYFKKDDFRYLEVKDRILNDATYREDYEK